MRYKNIFFRKAWYFFGCLVALEIGAQVPYNPISYNPSQALFNGSYTNGTYLNGNSGSSPYSALAQNLVINSAANYTLKPSNLLQIQAPMSVNNLTTGSFHACTEEISIASFHSSGWSNIPKYSRFEVGINLPFQKNDYQSGSMISNDIIRFLRNPGIASDKINPYDPEQLKIKCTFKSATNVNYIRYGFHYTSFQIETSGGKELWKRQFFDWPDQFTHYPFRIRFAPPETGTYQCKVEIYKNGVLQPYTIEFSFNVITNTVNQIADKGHLKLSNDGSKKLQYENGDPFFGIGQNIPFAKWNNCESAGKPNFPSKWFNSGDIYSFPESHTEQRGFIQDLSNKGGNFVRIRLDPWNVPIETEDMGDVINSSSNINTGNVNGGQPLGLDKCLNNYYHNQMFMGEMDKTLGLCETNGTKIMLSLTGDWEYSLENNDGVDYWKQSPYRYLLNGNDLSPEGMIDGIKKFFANSNNSNARAIFKKRLFYIMARWGYSPGIGIYQLINETETTGGAGKSTAYLGYSKLVDQDPTFKSNLVDWICEMVSYMKGLDQNSTDIIYPIHPFTTGTINDGAETIAAGGNYDKPLGDLNYQLFTHTPSCLDIYSINRYPAFTSGGIFQNDDDGKHQDAVTAFNLGYPMVWAEVGMFDGRIEWKNDRNFHNSLWTTALTGNISTAMYWNEHDQQYGTDHRANYTALKAFYDDVNYTLILKPKRKGGPGVQNSEVNTTLNKKIFNYWMRTDDKAYAIGWSMLGSSYWANDLPSSFYNSCINFACALFDATNDPLVSNIPDSGQPSDMCSCVYPTSGCFNYPQQSNSNYEYFKFISGFTNPVDYDATQGELDVVIYDLVPNANYFVDIYKTYGAGGHSGITLSKTANSSGELRFSRTMNNHDNSSSGAYPPDFAYIITLNTGQRQSGQAAHIVENNSITGVKNSDITVFPNPASDKINIAYDQEVFSKSSIQLLTETGQIVYSGNNEKKIDTKGIATGFYFLRFTSGDFVKTFKISIVH